MTRSLLPLLLPALAVALLLPGCQAQGSNTIPIANATRAGYCEPNASCWPKADDIAAFIQSMNGSQVLLRGEDVDWYSKKGLFNLLKDGAPAIVVIPNNVDAVRTAVRWAATYRIRLVVKCSGHDFNTRSTGFGIVQLCTEKLNSITYENNRRRFTLGAGVDWAAAYQAAKERGRVIVGGYAKSVCAAGCFMGGCHGIWGRKYGLGMDQVTRMQFVRFDGALLTLEPNNTHRELFNAILGSGHSTYGVVVSFTVKSFPAPKAIYNLKASWKLFPAEGKKSIFTDVVLNVDLWKQLSRDISIYWRIAGDTISADVLYVGNSYEEFLSIMQPLASDEYDPVIDAETGMPDVSATNYTDMVDFAEQRYDEPQTRYMRKMLSNVFVPADQAAADKFGQTIFELASQTTLLMDMVMLYGGAVTDNAAIGSVSEGMRGAMFEAIVGYAWYGPEEDAFWLPIISGVAGFLRQNLPHSYVNEYTSMGSKYNAITDWKTRFYGTKYDRLLAVKKEYDPCNMYTVEHGVGSDLPVATCRPRGL